MNNEKVLNNELKENTKISVDEVEKKRVKTAIEDIVKKILQEKNSDLTNAVENVYLLGQAFIISGVLMEDPEKTTFAKFQTQLRHIIKENDKLKEYVHEVMKNI